MNLSDWLNGLNGVGYAQLVSVTIEGVEYQGATYYARERTWLYLLGDLPKSYRRQTKCCYRMPNDERDWYIAGYWQGGKSPWPWFTEEDEKRYHPFGKHFLMTFWDDSTGTKIDSFESKPYRRIEVQLCIGSATAA